MARRPHLNPLALLRDIEARSRLRARGLPSKIEVKETWTGIGFRLGEANLVAPLSEVREMLPYPALTTVPGAKPWVKGIANIRGNLLPIMNLPGYLGQDSAAVTQQARVLVIHDDDIYAGLIVDAVYGLQHFFEEERCQDMPAVDESIRPYMQGAFLQAGRHWGVFDLHRLAHSPQFLQVAM